MSYNLTNFTTANTLLDYGVATNQLVGGLFFPVMLLLIFLVSTLAMKQYGNSGFLASSFITFVMAGFLWAVGLITEPVLLISFVLLIVAVFLNR